MLLKCFFGVDFVSKLGELEVLQFQEDKRKNAIIKASIIGGPIGLPCTTH